MRRPHRRGRATHPFLTAEQSRARVRGYGSGRMMRGHVSPSLVAALERGSPVWAKYNPHEKWWERSESRKAIAVTLA